MAAPSLSITPADSTRGARTVALAIAFVVLTASAIVAAGIAAPTPASADTIIDGPVDLGLADTFAVLAASTVTNTGPTTVSGDLGLSPGTSITGFGGAPDGSVSNGVIHQTDTDAADASSAASAAFGVAASLSPRASGLTELSGLVLRPGIYAGGAMILSDNGTLTLDGDSTASWVFQVASTLTIGSATSIVFTGGAGACNVFWRVGASATIGSAAAFAGTVVADQSISLTNGATVDGRLMALVGAVTLDTNRITAPTGCPPAGSVATSVPSTITSGEPTDATAGTPYAFAVTATGAPDPEYVVTDGELPAGLSLDRVSGIISGTPTTAGSSTFTITAETNTTDVDDAAEYVLVVSAAAAVPGSPAALTAAGSDAAMPLSIGVLSLLAGLSLVLVSRERHIARR